MGCWSHDGRVGARERHGKGSDDELEAQTHRYVRDQFSGLSTSSVDSVPGRRKQVITSGWGTSNQMSTAWSNQEVWNALH